MTCGEDVLFLVPFLTTIDTTMLAMLDPEPITELHQVFKHVPVSYVPASHVSGASKQHCSIVTLKNNKANNSSNTVFGPRGWV